MASEQALKIGELAALAGVNVQTVRYYERRQLLGEPVRTRAGYRQYSAQDVSMLRFIKRSQALGFSLEEAGELLKLDGEGELDRTEVRRIAQERLDEIEIKLRELHRLRSALRPLIEECATGHSEHCPILEAIDGN
ncbi:MAG: MerR family transcriptional regulator [Polyangiaceae bacterium]|nr:MerR family transcriptional regulator [Polyangiaceae bacterium]